MKLFLLASILCSLNVICAGQKNNDNNQAVTLSLEKKIPLEIKPYAKNQCVSYPLLKLLRDSLSKEGFIVVDSIKSSSLQQAFIKNMFNKSALQDKNEQEAKARFDKEMRSKKVVQQLSVENFSCLDTLHNYTIRVYLFPRPPEEDMKSISFTLPFSSPYRISDVILSLIERGPPKK